MNWSRGRATGGRRGRAVPASPISRLPPSARSAAAAEVSPPPPPPLRPPVSGAVCWGGGRWSGGGSAAAHRCCCAGRASAMRRTSAGHPQRPASPCPRATAFGSALSASPPFFIPPPHALIVFGFSPPSRPSPPPTRSCLCVCLGAMDCAFVAGLPLRAPPPLQPPVAAMHRSTATVGAHGGGWLVDSLPVAGSATALLVSAPPLHR